MKTLVSVVVFCGMIGGCSRAQREPTPDVRIPLSPHGLPNGFFRADADTKCAGEIIGYRFVVWLNSEDVAVGFNTSPNCRIAPNRKVDGTARLLVFSVSGVLKAKRDIPYLADGNGEVVAEGEARSGPSGTLLFRIESVNLDKEGRNESKSGVLLLDGDLNDVVRLDRFLEQTTLSRSRSRISRGVYARFGPRTYSVWEGAPPIETQRWKQDWPVGTMDRKFGEHGLAYVHCQQELQPGVYSSSNVVHAGSKMRCTMTAEAKDQTTWSSPLKEEGTAAIIGVLADGSVVGQINAKGNTAGRLVVWRKDQTTDTLPWIPSSLSGSVQSTTTDMSRYAVFATNDGELCENLGGACSDSGRWIVFDRKSQTPLADRAFPKNGRAALSPDGLRYASFESSELRIYSLRRPE